VVEDDASDAAVAPPPSSPTVRQNSAARHGQRGSEGNRESLDVRVCVRPGDALGAAFGITPKGALIFAIDQRGLLSRWNRANGQQLLRPGVTIVEVNGVTGYWSIVEELQKSGTLAMKVSTDPPNNAGPNWFQEIQQAGKRMTEQASVRRNSLLVPLEPGGAYTDRRIFSNLPTMLAGDCDIDQCAICIGDVHPEDRLVQLPCLHYFHALCAARWLSESGKAGQGQRNRCPLCCREIASTISRQTTLDTTAQESRQSTPDSAAR